MSDYVQVPYSTSYLESTFQPTEFVPPTPKAPIPMKTIISGSVFTAIAMAVVMSPIFYFQLEEKVKDDAAVTASLICLSDKVGHSRGVPRSLEDARKEDNGGMLRILKMLQKDLGSNDKGREQFLSTSCL